MPAPRRTARRTGRRTARRTARRTSAATSAAQSTYEPEPQEASPAEPLPAEPPPEPADDADAALTKRLQELGELHDQGVLTDEQFEEAKNRIIDADA